MKPTWSGEIIEGSWVFMRFAKILEKNLMSEFNTEMGRKLDGSPDVFPGFGIVEIIACSISAGGDLSENKSRQTFWKCGERISVKVP